MSRVRKKPSPMLVLMVMLLSMTAGSMALNKVAPLLQEITGYLGIADGSRAGMLISVFVLSGIFLTLPTGIISARVGLYPTGICALSAALVGSLLGLLPFGYGFMLLSRAVEGIGLVVLTTIGPVAVGRFFSGKKLASAMGCLMCFMALGQLMMLNLAPALAAVFSWHSAWWVTAAYSLTMLLVWTFTMGGVDAPGEGGGKQAPAVQGLKAAVKHRNVLLASGILLCYLIAQQGCSGFLVSYLSEVRGMTTAAASSVLSIAAAAGIPTGILVGIVSDRIGSRKVPIAVLMTGAAACYWAMPVWDTKIYGLLIFLWGISTMGVVGLCFSVVNEAAGAEHSSIFTAVLNTVQWFGVFLSSLIFGILKDAAGWNGAFGALVPLTLLAVVFAAFLKNNKNN